MLHFILNDQTIQTGLAGGTTLLDFIRYHRHLHGTKIGCREGDCGACTVLVGELQGDTVRYRTMTSCLTPLVNIRHKHVVTVEGINPPVFQGMAGHAQSSDQLALTPVQEAMVAENATQCGFCTPGFVMSLTCFCLSGQGHLPGQAVAAIDGNICRCTGYKSIERAAGRIAGLMQNRGIQTPAVFAVEKGIVPHYFLEISARLKAMQAAGTTDPAAEPTVVLLGGGTDLYVQRPEEMTHTPANALFYRPALRQIREEGDFIEIGGASTVTDLLESPLMQACFPALNEHLKLVSSTPIRNMATVAGNLANASPIGDLSIWFLALDAALELRNGPLNRQIPLRDFFLGYKTLAKSADEVATSIRFKKPGKAHFFNFEKVSKRTFLDIASVNSALLLQVENDMIKEAGLAIGGVAPVPLFLKKTSAFLIGKTLPAGDPMENDLLHEANTLLQSEISPISDVRGSAAYKRLLARQLFFAHFMKL